MTVMKWALRITKTNQLLLLRLALIIGIILAVYGNTYNHGFVWDDAIVIVDNPTLDSLKNLPSIFLSEDKVDMATGYYRPITYLSFALDKAIWGLNPLGFNITNIVLHCLVSVVLYLVVAELFKNELLAFITSLIFSLHPIANETLNFHAGGRNTLLCALFALLSFFFHMKRKLPAALTNFILAILSKEFALLMPVLFLFHDRLNSDKKPQLKYYVAYISATIGYLAIRANAVAAPNFLNHLDLRNLLWLTPKLVVNYLANMLLPTRLQTMYDITISRSFLQIIPYLSLLVLVFAFIAWFRKKREILIPAAWVFLFMLPVSGIIPLGITTMADRYVYFSSMGFAMALAYLILLAPRNAVILVMLALCSAYAAIDFQHNFYWSDDITLFTQMIKDVPGKSVGYQNLSIAYYNKGDFDNAAKYLTDACFKATDNGVQPTRLTESFWEMKKYDKAMTVLRMRIELEPNNPHPYMIMSRIYGELGDKAREKTYHDKAVQLFPRTEEVMDETAAEVFREGEKLLAEHRFLLAKQRFQDALNIDLNYVPALVDMGILSSRKNDFESATRFLTKALAIDPLNATAHLNLSSVLQMQGKTAEAENELKKFNEAESIAKRKGNVVPQ